MSNLNIAQLPAGARVLCALSGGADSVALLSAVAARRAYFGAVGAAHFHHGLRGADADEDAAFCHALAARLHVPLHYEQGNVRAEPSGRGLEADARQRRYEFLQHVAAAHGYTHIATGHTADDQVETLLLNLTRGTGLTGLTGIPATRGNIVRPLLAHTKADILAYVQAQGLTYRTDNSNLTDDYRRNRFRHHVVPLLAKENPKLTSAVGRTVTLLSQDVDYLDTQARDARRALHLETGVISLSGLRMLHTAIASRVVRFLYQEVSNDEHDLLECHINAILSLAKSNVSAVTWLPHGYIARRMYDRLTIEKALAILTFLPLCLSFGQTKKLPELGLLVSWQKKPKNVHNLVYSFSVTSATIGIDLVVRPRKAGDTITIRHTKKLQDVFVDAKVPRHLRDAIPVIADGTGVICVCGVGVAARVRPRDAEDQTVLEFFREE